MTKPVDFISAIPGIGKTKWAVEQLVSCVRSQSNLAMYVAPTVELLTEVKKYVTKELTGEESKRVLIFHSKHGRVGSVSRSIDLALRGGADEHKRVFKKAKSGTVLLVTHAAFLNLSKLPQLEKIDLYFDEARKCVSQSATIRLSSKEHRQVINEMLTFHEDEDTGFMRVTTNIDKRTFNECMKKVAWEPRQYRSVEHLVRSARNPRLETYVRGKANAKALNIFEVTLPSKIFEGFKSVTLLSAFFEDSQMYHLLKLKKVPMRDVTKEKIADYARRYPRILNRYAAVSIVPLMPQNFALSKSHLSGFLLSQKRADILDELAELGYTTRKDLLILKEYAIDSSQYELKAKDRAALKLLKANSKYLQFDPLSWMLKKTDSVIANWQKEAGLDEIRDPLLIVNKVYQSRAEDLAPDYRIISTQVHGLNKYYQHAIVIFLAAINPTPAMFQFYRNFLPEYDVERDHVADVCVQCVCRGSVRDTKATQPSLVIVPDLKIMGLLHDKMSFYPKTRADLRPSADMIAASLNAKSDSKIKVRGVSKALSNKEKQEKYKENPLNKELTVLRSTLSRYRKQIKEGKPVQDKILKVEQKISDLTTLKRSHEANSTPILS